MYKQNTNIKTKEDLECRWKKTLKKFPGHRRQSELSEPSPSQEQSFCYAQIAQRHSLQLIQYFLVAGVWGLNNFHLGHLRSPLGVKSYTDTVQKKRGKSSTGTILQHEIDNLSMGHNFRANKICNKSAHGTLKEKNIFGMLTPSSNSQQCWIYGGQQLKISGLSNVA